MELGRAFLFLLDYPRRSGAVGLLAGWRDAAGILCMSFEIGGVIGRGVIGR